MTHGARSAQYRGASMEYIAGVVNQAFGDIFERLRLEIQRYLESFLFGHFGYLPSYDQRDVAQPDSRDQRLTLNTTLNVEKVTEDVFFTPEEDDSVFETCRCSPLLSIDPLSERWLKSDHPEDDADSGYHTGDSLLRGQKSGVGAATWSREELRRQIDKFNQNQHGLLMTLQENGSTFQGFIRVYMNLMRPISMALPARPPSIYDVLGSEPPEEDEDAPSAETLTTSFYLPKDTTKVIHITSRTTAQEVITALLQKFKITDNPRKFALYEKSEDSKTRKWTMRRLQDAETPLPLCLSWTADGLHNHRFVLQENEPGEIMWEAFSVPELENFLKILNREEEEYIDQLKHKYHMLRIHLTREMHAMEKERALEANEGKLRIEEDANGELVATRHRSQTPPASPDTTTFNSDTREPVFV